MLWSYLLFQIPIQELNKYKANFFLQAQQILIHQTVCKYPSIVMDFDLKVVFIFHIDTESSEISNLVGAKFT